MDQNPDQEGTNQNVRVYLRSTLAFGNTTIRKGGVKLILRFRWDRSSIWVTNKIANVQLVLWYLFPVRRFILSNPSQSSPTKLPKPCLYSSQVRLKSTEPAILFWSTLYPPPAVGLSQYTLKAPEPSGSIVETPLILRPDLYSSAQSLAIGNKIKMLDVVGML